MSFTAELKQFANSQGFQLVGACPAVAPTGMNNLLHWIENGFAGQMTYIEHRKDAYRHPDSVLGGVKSLLLLGMNYATSEANQVSPGHGLVSKYAWGNGDYHDLIHERMKRIKSWLKERKPDSISRGVVDTAPLLERDFARLSGLGWLAKNTMLINRDWGSFFFLAAVLTDLELEYDSPFEADHCGSCTACLDACPTNAFPSPYVLDATKCISYLTIEHRGEIPLELRNGMQDWIFGCDICQDVCPWNRKTTVSHEPCFQPIQDSTPMNLSELFGLSDVEFRARFRKTPLWRTKRAGLLRNAAIVLGNQRHVSALPALKQGLADGDPIVRDACQWAIDKIKSDADVAPSPPA